MRRTLTMVILSGVAGYLLWEGSPWTGSPQIGRETRAAQPQQAAPAIATGEAQVLRQVTPPAPPAPGEAIRVELIEPPAQRYADPSRTEADQVYARVVGELGRRDVLYDPNLGHAARELAYQHSLMGGLVPPAVVDFLLHSAGAVDRSVTQAYTATTGDDLSAVRQRLDTLLGPEAAGGLFRVGVGEAWVPGAKRPRYIAMLVSRRRLDVSPAPRRVEPGGEWILSGVLPDGWEQASGLVLHPGGLLETVPATSRGRRFTLRVRASHDPGPMEVSLSAVGPTGPSPLMQVPVHVGPEVPTVFDGRLLPDETDITTRQQAEALAFELLNADRRRYGLPPLVRDARLDQVARAHSIDMRDSGVFGHWSDNTGTPGDRLAAGGFKAVTHGENVATGPGIHSAQEGLMRSLGHRRNILAEQFTHVGIGVAGRQEDGRTIWHLTQMFAKPSEAIVPRTAGLELTGRLQRLRERARLDLLDRRLDLDALASDAARVAAAGGNERVASDLLVAAREARLTSGGAYAWVRVATDLDELDLPLEVTDPGYTRIGVAVEQLEDHPNGLIGVAILLTGAPR